MAIESSLPLLEQVLAPWKDDIGVHFTGYRNHVYRMVNFTFALHDCDAEARDKIAIAAGFHDLGLWSDRTVDYLPPSVLRARRFLHDRGCDHWSDEIERMIDEHHKLRAYRDARYPLVEPFRQADLVDVSLGRIRFGLPAAFVREVRTRFPNAGFHRNLLRLAGGWFKQHPLSPPPFLKW